MSIKTASDKKIAKIDRLLSAHAEAFHITGYDAIWLIIEALEKKKEMLINREQKIKDLMALGKNKK